MMCSGVRMFFPSFFEFPRTTHLTPVVVVSSSSPFSSHDNASATANGLSDAVVVMSEQHVVYPSSSSPLSSSLPIEIEGLSSRVDNIHRRRIFHRSNEYDDDNGDDEEILSLSSDTSATSVASDISDGVTRRTSSSAAGRQQQQQRPRSISLGGYYGPPALVVAATTTNTTTRITSSSSAGRQRSVSISMTTTSSGGYNNNHHRPMSNPRRISSSNHRRMRNNVSASPLGIRPDTNDDEETRDYEAGREGVVEHIPTTAVATTTAVAVGGDFITDSNSNNNIDSIPPPPQAADNEGTVLLDVVLESVAIGNNISVPPRVMMDNRLVVPPSLQQQQQQQQQRLHGATTTTAARVTAHPAAGTLLRAPHRRAAASLSITNNTTTTTSSSLLSSHPHRQVPIGKSNKQHPSHRKIRRWDNDNFIGHPVAETTHLQLLHSEDGGNWKEYYMPNYPTYYRSSFAKLIHDTSDVGKVVRDKFYKGEVASSVGGGGTTMGSGGGMHLGGGRNIKCNTITMTDCIIYRMSKLGLSSSLLLAHQQQQQVEKTKKQKDNVGRVLYQQLLTSRIQSVLVQSCGGISIFENSSSNMNEACATVSAFERYLVSLALVGTTTTKQDNKTMMTRSSSSSDCNGDNIDSIVVAGDFYPPIQSKEVYDVFHKVLSRPPKIVIKSTTIMPSTSTITSSSSLSMTACWIPTVHFYFSTDTTTSSVVDGGRSSAFHRILLYSVCQFHGLVVSSSIIDNSSSRGGGGTKKTTTNTNKQLGEKGEAGKKKSRCIEKVVTIQAGVMLAPTLRLLDYVI